MRSGLVTVVLLFGCLASGKFVPERDPTEAALPASAASVTEPMLSSIGSIGAASGAPTGTSAALSFLEGRRLGGLRGPVPMSPNQIIIYGAIAIGIASVLAGVAIIGARYYVKNCVQDQYNAAAPGPVWAGDDSVQVLVQANGQEAELEVQADGFESYEMLRELVVDSLPGMFDDSDEIVLDYLDEQSRWVRVKTRTPLEALKSSGNVKISCRSSQKSSRALVEPSRKKKGRSKK